MRILTGIALLGTVGLLLMAHLEQRSYRRGRLLTLVAGITLIVLDAAACSAVLRYSTPANPVVLAALAASMLRVAAVLTLTARQLVRS